MDVLSGLEMAMVKRGDSRWQAMGFVGKIKITHGSLFPVSFQPNGGNHASRDLR